MWEPIITFILLLACLTILLLRYHELPVYCRPIGIIVICHLVFYSFTAYLMFNKTNNMILFHVLKPLQYSLTAFFLVDVISNRVTKKALLLSVPAFILLSIFFSLAVQNIEEYNSYSILIHNFLILLWILLYFRDLLTNVSFTNLFATPSIWISIGLLFYCVGTTFSEGLMNYLINHHRPYALSFYYVGIVLSFFLYGFIILGLVCDKLFNRETV